MSHLRRRVLLPLLLQLVPLGLPLDDGAAALVLLPLERRRQPRYVPVHSFLPRAAGCCSRRRRRSSRRRRRLGRRAVEGGGGHLAGGLGVQEGGAADLEVGVGAGLDAVGWCRVHSAGGVECWLMESARDRVRSAIWKSLQRCISPPTSSNAASADGNTLLPAPPAPAPAAPAPLRALAPAESP
jgi:hypothetical protein